jgi:hypothetical protein
MPPPERAQCAAHVEQATAGHLTQEPGQPLLLAGAPERAFGLLDLDPDDSQVGHPTGQGLGAPGICGAESEVVAATPDVDQAALPAADQRAVQPRRVQPQDGVGRGAEVAGGIGVGHRPDMA